MNNNAALRVDHPERLRIVPPSQPSYPSLLAYLANLRSSGGDLTSVVREHLFIVDHLMTTLSEDDYLLAHELLTKCNKHA